MTIVVIQGAKGVEDIPGIERIAGDVELRFAPDTGSLGTALVGADVLLGWDFAAAGLRDVWDSAGALRWIHWGGAGVNAALFPELVESEVALTATRGIFDRAMAESVLGFIIAFAKRFPETVNLQSERRWKHRLTERIDGRRALVVGVGSIGREIARLLRAVGMTVDGVGRTARTDDPDFNRIASRDDLHALLADADYVVLVVPHTAETVHMFGPGEFRAMKPTARLINVGRGSTVDEAALAAALEAGEIAGAALDVFETEPLPAESPLWNAPGVMISPHMTGDFSGFAVDVFDLFEKNLRRYLASEPLLNVVDKLRGYVPAAD